MVTAYGCVGTYATATYPYLPPGAMESSGGGSQLTGTGVGSNFRFVSDLELKPARGRSRGISPLQGNDKESGFTKSVNMSARSAVVAAS